MALQWVISKITVTVKLVKITSGDFEQSMAQRRRMFQSQWRPNIYFSQRFPVPILSQPPLLNRDQSKCIVDLSGNSQLSLQARNSCIDSQWYKKTYWLAICVLIWPTFWFNQSLLEIKRASMSDGKSGFLTPPEEFIQVHVGHNISIVCCQEKIIRHGICEFHLSYF